MGGALVTVCDASGLVKRCFRNWLSKMTMDGMRAIIAVDGTSVSSRLLEEQHCETPTCFSFKIEMQHCSTNCLSVCSQSPHCTPKGVDGLFVQLSAVQQVGCVPHDRTEAMYLAMTGCLCDHVQQKMGQPLTLKAWVRCRAPVLHGRGLLGPKDFQRWHSPLHISYPRWHWRRPQQNACRY